MSRSFEAELYYTVFLNRSSTIIYPVRKIMGQYLKNRPWSLFPPHHQFTVYSYSSHYLWFTAVISHNLFSW